MAGQMNVTLQPQGTCAANWNEFQQFVQSQWGETNTSQMGRVIRNLSDHVRDGQIQLTAGMFADAGSRCRDMGRVLQVSQTLDAVYAEAQRAQQEIDAMAQEVQQLAAAPVAVEQAPESVVAPAPMRAAAPLARGVVPQATATEAGWSRVAKTVAGLAAMCIGAYVLGFDVQTVSNFTRPVFGNSTVDHAVGLAQNLSTWWTEVQPTV